MFLWGTAGGGAPIICGGGHEPSTPPQFSVRVTHNPFKHVRRYEDGTLSYITGVAREDYLLWVGDEAPPPPPLTIDNPPWLRPWVHVLGLHVFTWNWIIFVSNTPSTMDTHQENHNVTVDKQPYDWEPSDGRKSHRHARTKKVPTMDLRRGRR